MLFAQGKVAEFTPPAVDLPNSEVPPEVPTEPAAGSIPDIPDLSSIDWMLIWNQYGIGAVKVIAVLFITWIAARVVSSMIQKTLKRAKFDETLSKFFSKVARWCVLVLGVLACLSMFGVETTTFAAVLGAAGLAIGLAFQGTLANFASGVMLLIFRPFKVGQVISVGGEVGKVDEIELFTTTLDTPDNRRVILPNSTVFGATIENVSHHGTRRVDVPVGCSYAADIDMTRHVLEQAAARTRGALTDPAPQIYLCELGASCVDWSVRVWCTSEDYFAVREELIRSVKYALDEAQIEIPYPQMDININQAVVPTRAAA